MNESVKQKWVAALRSGSYAQGIGRLRSEDGSYCCLGVLCDLYNKESVAVGWTNAHYANSPEWIFRDALEDLSDTVLTRDVLDWADLDDENPVVNNESLAESNDKGRCFNAIADDIEAFL